MEAICLATLAEKVIDSGPPWNSFGSDNLEAAVFSTGRAVLDLPSSVWNQIDESLRDRARRELQAWLRDDTSAALSRYLPLVLRAALGLRKLDPLPIDIEVRVGEQAQRDIDRMISRNALGDALAIDRCLLALALVSDAEFSHGPLLPQERKSVLGLCLDGSSLTTVAQSTIVRVGTDAVGCSGIEALVRLLQCDGVRPLLVDHGHHFHATLDWLEARSRRLETGTGKVVRVFQSDLYPDHGRYEAWFNALVAVFLFELERFCQDQVDRAAKHRFDARVPTPDVSYDGLVCGGYRWPERLEERLLKPVADGGCLGKSTGNGIVLFGPPGTGKTTIAQTIAKRLGWDFVRLSTADFLVDGSPNLVRTIKTLFRQLHDLSKCVVLFDELELLIVDRQAGDIQAGWLTNVMLPELQEFHDAMSVLPILATNHVEKLDPAGRRPGRFDYVLPVGLPNVQEREHLLRIARPNLSNVARAARVCDGATIAEVFEFARSLGTIKRPTDERLATAWAPISDSRRVDSAALLEFQSTTVTKYAYPPTWK
ncbi:MAG: AAA family ATPase [bacterium]